MFRHRQALLSFALACGAGAVQAQAAQQEDDWLTVHGFPEQPQGDLIQVNPTPVPWQDRFTIEVRVSRSMVRDGYNGQPYRSFKAVAVVDCTTRKGWYLTIQYFIQPSWQGTPTSKRDFRENEAPVAFKGIAGDPSGKLIAAACKTR